MSTPPPTLTDGSVTLRPWRDDDIGAAIAGHDDEIGYWTGTATAPTAADLTELVGQWRAAWTAGEPVAAYVVEHEDGPVGNVEVTTGGVITWALWAGHRRRGLATRAVRVLVDWALTDRDLGGLGLLRVQARIDPRNTASLRVATRSGMRREGIERVVAGTGDRPDATQYVVHARLATDPPLSEPESFRALLNSFLPRKRAISQLLVRDHDDRILLCQLTYKTDWDLPGGVVEVGESPQLAAAREVAEELGIAIPAGDLLTTDWLPPWGGWDDALCLVFDGGHHDAAILAGMVRQEREIRTAEFCTLEQVDERCRDFTARRIRAALGSRGSTYTESGRGPS